MSSLTPKVTVIDYGVGNVMSVTRGLEACGAQVTLSSDPKMIVGSDRVVLPGVGAFADGMKGLYSKGLVEPMIQYAKTGRPLLGICLGMQMLFDVSEEFGTHQGLGLVKGKVAIIPPTTSSGAKHKIPHIGWNELTPSKMGRQWKGTLLEDVPQHSSVYFVHSYTPEPARLEDRLADSHYNGRLISAVIQSGAISGCQFHPEKSGSVGLKILGRFCRF